MSTWSWVATSKRYRDEKGRFVSAAKVRDLRNGYVEQQQVWARDLAGSVADRHMTVQQWERAMRDRTKRAFTAEYLLGRGGTNAMTAADWGTLGSMLKEQYRYLRGFAEDMVAGDLSAEYVANRAGLYFHSATQAFERGRATAWGVEPPQVPGDGGTQCLARCNCYLEYKTVEGGVEVTWRTAAGSDTCQDCADMEAAWSPLFLATS